MSNKKLYFALLNSGWIRREFASEQLFSMMHTPGIDLVWEDPAKTWGHPIYANRNKIVKRFLATDCDYLMMQDDDIIPLHNPAELVFADKDVIGCPAKVRSDGQTLNWVAFVEDKSRGGYYAVDMASAPTDADLVEVDIVGTGLILIRRNVIEKLGLGCFTVENDEDGTVKFGTDFAFCRRAKEAGFQVYTTPHRTCEHMKEVGLLEMSAYDDSDNFCHDNSKYELHWGGWSILQKDWRFIKDVIESRGVKTIVEFGSGLSSLLMSEIADVTTYETDGAYLDETAGKKTPSNKLTLVLWDGVDAPTLPPCDMVFVDGPPGNSKNGRRFSYEAAGKSGAKYIITHDSGREKEQALAKEFLWGKYELAGNSGLHQQRCELWVKKA